MPPISNSAAAGDLAAAAETLKSVLKSDPRADWAYNELIELL